MNYLSFQSPVGIISVTQTNDFITEVDFNSFPQSACEYETPLLKEAKRQLDAYFEGRLKTFSLPLNPKGSPFYNKIWKILLEIPYGKTASYKEIAVRAGNPKAARAVGMANNHNPIAIIIPCHRVIGSDGSLTGYASGLDIKRKLLELEKKCS